MSRHQANRRRTYGRRQHELREREDPGMDWPADGPAVSPRDLAATDELRPLPLGDLLGHPLWRWVPGRG
ncbi:MAG: hypothetical protein ACHQZR_08100 [Candidatus Limnocylindrales bacterium]